MAENIIGQLKRGGYFKTLPKKPQSIDLGTIDDYFPLFATLRQHYGTSYLFESLANNEHSDPCVTFGFDPLLRFQTNGMALQITDRDQQTETLQTANPYLALAELIPHNFEGDAHHGGLIGNATYETVNLFEPSLNLPTHTDFPLFEFGLYLDGLVFNIKSRQLEYYYYDESRIDIVQTALDSPLEVPAAVTRITQHGHNQTKRQHTAAVDYALGQIRHGNSFQVEIGFKTKYTIIGDKLAVYAHLREVNPGPYMYYLQFGRRELFGSSPEIIVRNSGGRLLTTPAAGTVRRGATPAEDKRLAEQLQQDPKEIAEHNMLIDLHRNDLARVSRIGSVQLDRAKYTAKYSHVQHLLSDITGQLADGATSFDVLAAMTPCGVLTGAPKIETIKIIHHTEPEPRGPYGGAVGRFSLNGDCVFTMPIRSLFCSGDDCFAQTASGVVLDSTPAGEYEEVIRKLAAMETVMQHITQKSRHAVAASR